MIFTAVAIAAIAAGLVPLIQRDLRLAHARIEARRRRRTMHPLVRAFEDLQRDVCRVFAEFGRAMERAGHQLAEAFGDRTRP